MPSSSTPPLIRRAGGKQLPQLDCELDFPDPASYREFRSLAREQRGIYGAPKEGGGWAVPSQSESERARFYETLQFYGGKCEVRS